MSAACERQIAEFGRLRKKHADCSSERSNGRPPKVKPRRRGAGGARFTWWGTGGRVLPSHALQSGDEAIGSEREALINAKERSWERQEPMGRHVE